MKRRPLTDAPERLEPEERKRIIAWAKEKYPQFVPRDQHGRDDLSLLTLEWEKCRDRHLKFGEQAKSWEAAFRMWLRKKDEFEVRDRARGKGERIKLDTPIALGVILGGKGNG